MTRRSFRDKDDLSVFISLITSIAIVIGTIAGMWVWSLVSKNLVRVSIESVADIP